MPNESDQAWQQTGRTLACALYGLFERYGHLLKQDEPPALDADTVDDVVVALRDIVGSLRREVWYADRHYPAAMPGAASYRLRIRQYADAMQQLLARWEAIREEQATFDEDEDDEDDDPYGLWRKP